MRSTFHFWYEGYTPEGELISINVEPGPLTTEAITEVVGEGGVPYTAGSGEIELREDAPDPRAAQADFEGTRGQLISYEPEHHPEPLTAAEQVHVQYLREALVDLGIAGAVQYATEERNTARRAMVMAADQLRKLGGDPAAIKF